MARPTDPDRATDPLVPWERLVERQIREAMEAGAFDDLPYRGRPIPIEDESAAGAWAVAYRMLRNAGIAPPWIEADKDVRAWLAKRDALLGRAPRTGVLTRPTARAELRRIVFEANRSIERLNAEAPTDRQHRRPLDVDVELAALEAAFG
jgi:hypothetical protein